MWVESDDGSARHSHHHSRWMVVGLPQAEHGSSLSFKVSAMAAVCSGVRYTAVHFIIDLSGYFGWTPNPLVHRLYRQEPSKMPFTPTMAAMIKTSAPSASNTQRPPLLDARISSIGF